MLPAKKTSGARHAFGSDSSGLFALNQQIAGGPSRAAGLGHVFRKRFVVNGYEHKGRSDSLEHNLVFMS